LRFFLPAGLEKPGQRNARSIFFLKEFPPCFRSPPTFFSLAYLFPPQSYPRPDFRSSGVFSSIELSFTMPLLKSVLPDWEWKVHADSFFLKAVPFLPPPGIFPFHKLLTTLDRFFSFFKAFPFLADYASSDHLPFFLLRVLFLTFFST